MNPDALGAEDAEPHEGVDGGDDQGGEDELAQRAALRDLGQEGADEGAPGDPPAPVEERPGREPAAAAAVAVGGAAEAQHLAAETLEGVRLEADLHEVPEVVAEGLHGDVQGEVGLAEEEHGQQQEHADAEGHLNMLYYRLCDIT